jgi:hypothetical protein
MFRERSKAMECDNREKPVEIIARDTTQYYMRIIFPDKINASNSSFGFAIAKANEIPALNFRWYSNEGSPSGPSKTSTGAKVNSARMACSQSDERTKFG